MWIASPVDFLTPPPIVTIPAPTVVSYCDPGNPATGEYDGQKNCPAMAPVLVLGRS